MLSMALVGWQIQIKTMKRLFDLLASAMGLLLLAVPLAVLAWQVNCHTPLVVR